MTISFVCVCDTPYTAQDAQAGQTFTCPTCQQAVLIPGVQAAPTAAASPPVQQEQQGWAGNFFSGEAKAPPSRGTQLLAELTANSDSAMDDELLGHRSQKPPPVIAPALAVSPPTEAAAPPGSYGHIDMEMDLLPDSDIAKAPAKEDMDAAFDEVANMFEQPAAPPKQQRQQQRRAPSQHSSERQRKPASQSRKGQKSRSAERPRAVENSSSRKRRKMTQSSERPARRRGRQSRGSSVEAAERDGNPHITNCHVCDEQISRKARECPFCSAPMPSAPRFAAKNKQNLKYAKVGVAILGLLILVGIAGKMIFSKKSSGKRRRRIKVVDVPDPVIKPVKDPVKDPKKDLVKDPKKDPKKDPAKGPKKDPEKPLARFEADLKNLRRARDPGEILDEINKLGQKPQAKQICKSVINVEKDSILAGYCHQVLFQVLKDQERDQALKLALHSDAFDAVYKAVEIVIQENKEDLKKLFKGNRMSSAPGRRFGGLYAFMLLGIETPTDDDLMSGALVMDGTSIFVKPRLAVLRLLGGDGLAMQEALKAFDIKNVQIKEGVQRALTQYTEKEDITLEDPESADHCRAAKTAWTSWYNAYKPIQEPLARACLDPNSVQAASDRDKLQSAARKLRHEGLVTLLSLKDKPMISYMRTFSKAESVAKTAVGVRTIASLIEQIGSREDIPLLVSWLDSIQTKTNSKVMAAAILNVAGREAVPAALRMLERKVISAVDLAAVLPDLGRVSGPEVDALVNLVDLYQKEAPASAEPIWLILASLGSKKVEEAITAEQRGEGLTFKILTRYRDSKFEKKLFDAATKKTPIPHIDEGQAARYLSRCGSSRMSKQVFSLIKKPQFVNFTAQMIRSLAQPSHKKKLLDGLKNSHSGIAGACMAALTDMHFTDRATAGKFAALYNNADCPYYLKIHLKNELIKLREAGKRQPRDDLLVLANLWKKNYAQWETTKSSSPPTLPRAVIDGIGRVGDAKRDSQLLLSALAATSSNSDKEGILKALGHLRSKDGAYTMKRYLLPGGLSRGMAALALSQIKAKEAIPEMKMVLVESKRLERDDGLILMAISIIDPEMGLKVYQSVKAKKIPIDGSAMPGVAFVLARDPEAEGLEDLKRLTVHNDARARAGVAYGIALAMAYKEDEVAGGIEEIFKPLLFDEQEKVRVNALLACLALKSDFAAGFLYPTLREKPSGLRTQRNDTWSEYLEPKYVSEDFERWIYRLAKKRNGFRKYLSDGCKREILINFRKVKKR
jgi:hypothetical protein